MDVVRDPTPPRRGWTTALRALLIAIAIAVLAFTFGEVDAGRVVELLEGAGPIALLLLLPAIVALAIETSAWKGVYQALGHRVRFLPLFEIRVATESISRSLPGGILWAEAVKPSMLRRTCDLAVAPSLAGMAGRKYLLLVSQGFYLLLACVLGWSFYGDVSPAVIGNRALPWLVAVCVVYLLVGAWLVAVTLRYAGVAMRLLELLQRLPWARWQAYLADRRRGFRETDRHLGAVFALDRRQLVKPTLGFFVAWLLEAAETYLILRAVGVEITLVHAMAIEVVAVFVRHVFVAFPSGLGVQDLGYVTLLAAVGVPDPVNSGAAFSLIKRSKELFWISVGWGLLLLDRRLRFGDASDPEPRARSEATA